MRDKAPSRINDEKVDFYERINRDTGQRSIQIGADKIASPKLDEQGRPTIEIYEQRSERGSR